MKAWSLQIGEPGKWQHIMQNRKLFIEKDGKVIEFSEDEIIDILRALGIATGDFMNGYWK